MMGGTAVAIVLAACAGVAATVTMDLLGSAARRAGLVRGAEGRWVGRWYLGIARGRLTHADIAVADGGPPGFLTRRGGPGWDRREPHGAPAPHRPPRQRRA